MKKIKLTTREKVIIGVSLVVVAVVGIKLKRDIFQVASRYNRLAEDIISKGTVTAYDVTNTGFKLRKVVACCGGGCKEVVS